MKKPIFFLKGKPIYRPTFWDRIIFAFLHTYKIESRDEIIFYKKRKYITYITKVEDK